MKHDVAFRRDRLRELGENATVPLPHTLSKRLSQACDLHGDAVFPRVCDAEALRETLGLGIAGPHGRWIKISIIQFRDGIRGRRTIHLHRRQKDKSPDLSRPGQIQHVDDTIHRRADHLDRSFHKRAGTGLRRGMNDVVHAIPIQFGGPHHIPLNDPNIRKGFKHRLRPSWTANRSKDFNPRIRRKGPHQCGTQQSRGPRHKNRHAIAPSRILSNAPSICRSSDVVTFMFPRLPITR